ncbi:MAG TPA: Wzz/FepE/Etk N-terminal domain-containing protein, partial [Caldimonas sp.]|nr:Wzz/FepE/Etk N-terminal domain-containing protein [Caldimonas sp.]
MSAVLQEAPVAYDPSAEGGKSLRELVDVLRRRRLLIASVAAGLFAIAVAVAFALPAVYRSSATILIKEQEIPQEFVRSTVTSFADERIQVISQQIMTRATLLELVD